MVSSYNLGSRSYEFSPAVERTLFAFGGIALYNVVELAVLIALTFRRRGGLYFWSLIVSTIAILPYTLGLLFRYFDVIPSHLNYLAITLIDIGWQGMVTGQSVVLYSRLHLVASSRILLRVVLGIIIANWFISNVPTTVFVYLSNTSRAAATSSVYGVWERLQLCLYFAQEIFISAIYIFQISKIMRPDMLNFGKTEEEKPADARSIRSGLSTIIPRGYRSAKGKRVMRHLLYVNAAIVALDVSLLVTEFIGHYEVQTVYKAAVYSMKLKMEFRILNQLTDIAQEKLRVTNDYFSSAGDSTGSKAGYPESSHKASIGTVMERPQALQPPPVRMVPQRAYSAMQARGCLYPDLEADSDDSDGPDTPRRMSHPTIMPSTMMDIEKTEPDQSSPVSLPIPSLLFSAPSPATDPQETRAPESDNQTGAKSRRKQSTVERDWANHAKPADTEANMEEQKDEEEIRENLEALLHDTHTT